MNYPFLNHLTENLVVERQEIFVDRIIDGDTIESNKTSIRLLGINTPERGEFLYEEAKKFLEDEILKENVTLEFIGEKTDKYYRTLAYVFLNDENINTKIVENGFANYYFYSGRDKYSDDLIEAWNRCLERNINLCEVSTHSCASCIIINSDYIENICSFSCNISNWEIKLEGRDKFIFEEQQVLTQNSKFEFKLDLENSGGSLFLRDDLGKLVNWKK